MNDPSRVRVFGPLEPFAAGFSRSLMRQGHPPIFAALQVQLMAHLSRWIGGEGLDVRELRATDVERFRCSSHPLPQTAQNVWELNRACLLSQTQMGVPLTRSL